MLPQEPNHLDRIIEMVRTVIVTKCPFITQKDDENGGVIVIHFTPRQELPRIERITFERPLYKSGKVYIKHQKQEHDEDNLEFALEIIESKLYLAGQMISGSVWFHFTHGLIENIETKSSMLYDDIV